MQFREQNDVYDDCGGGDGGAIDDDDDDDDDIWKTYIYLFGCDLENRMMKTTILQKHVLTYLNVVGKTEW